MHISSQGHFQIPKNVEASASSTIINMLHIYFDQGVLISLVNTMAHRMVALPDTTERWCLRARLELEPMFSFSMLYGEAPVRETLLAIQSI